MLVIEQVYYFKSSRSGISSVNVVKSCGMGIEPNECIDIESTTIINENTWYISESNEVSITYNGSSEEVGTLYYTTGNGIEFIESETAHIAKIDTNAPIIEINNIESTKEKITIPITITENESGLKSRTCKYSSDTSYELEAIISTNKCEIAGLEQGETINYQVCAEDMVGNTKCETGSATTKRDFEIGEDIYFNPVEGNFCNNYVSTNSNAGVKSGCMKWFAVSKTDNTVSLLLDHNTTAGVKWWNKSGTNYNNPGQTTFNNDVKDWKIELNPRLLTRGEVCNIIGNIGNCSTKGSVSFDSSKYWWLVESAPNNSKLPSYWLEDYYSNKGTSGAYKYYVNTGNIKIDTIASSYGIRPVITISTN